jgi:hypothetical protein
VLGWFSTKPLLALDFEFEMPFFSRPLIRRASRQFD